MQESACAAPALPGLLCSCLVMTSGSRSPPLFAPHRPLHSASGFVHFPIFCRKVYRKSHMFRRFTGKSGSKRIRHGLFLQDRLRSGRRSCRAAARRRAPAQAPLRQLRRAVRPRIVSGIPRRLLTRRRRSRGSHARRPRPGSKPHRESIAAAARAAASGAADNPRKRSAYGPRTPSGRPRRHRAG